MSKQISSIAIFDVGKTNKKLFVFDEQYKLVYELSCHFDEIKDEDGFACEDIDALTEWLKSSFSTLAQDKRFLIKALNFSAYGASFVHLDDKAELCMPLYNYLKPYPPKLQDQFYHRYGGEELFARQAASPVLGNLNSGMQLYRLKYEKPEAFGKIRYSLHLPQYLSYVFTGKPASDITSIGCHTNLWNFDQHAYHDWVALEGIDKKLAPILPCDSLMGNTGQQIAVGIGLHDSSAALIPYLAAITEPFVLLSTGTWCISLNPFNHDPLTDQELAQDCLCYLSYRGQPVKASRLFAGQEHEQQTKKLARHFNKADDYYAGVQFDPALVPRGKDGLNLGQGRGPEFLKRSSFEAREIGLFKNYEEAYHQLIADIISQQVYSTNLVLSGSGVKRIFVDGGFGKNPVFMNLLAGAFSELEVFAASVAQATALGAAMAIHQHWNSRPLPNDLIELKLYSSNRRHSIG